MLVAAGMSIGETGGDFEHEDSNFDLSSKFIGNIDKVWGKYELEANIDRFQNLGIEFVKRTLKRVIKMQIPIFGHKDNEMAIHRYVEPNEKARPVNPGGIPVPVVRVRAPPESKNETSAKKNPAWRDL